MQKLIDILILQMFINARHLFFFNLKVSILPFNEHLSM